MALTDVGALARGLGRDQLEALERTLIEADFGVPATLAMVRTVEERVRRGELKTEDDLRQAVQRGIVDLLQGPPEPAVLGRAVDGGVTVILFVGVNGVGKTTTVAKVARRLQREGRSVLLAAADTYRAGAIQQLQAWADRLQVPCVTGASGGDPAAVAFDAIEAATARGCDSLLVDTAGRLHTQEGLMEELRKVARVIGRKRPGAPHETLLVLDGTVGQNAVQQGKLFGQAVRPTGIIVTKLDGTARGGAVVALRRELDVPIRFLGMGEGVDDLVPFDAAIYAARLLDG
jgi:fused signal recognition particle receptor